MAKYADMGYKVTREIPKLKDFNEDLVNIVNVKQIKK